MSDYQKSNSIIKKSGSTSCHVIWCKNPLDKQSFDILPEINHGESIRGYLDRVMGKDFEFTHPTIAIMDDIPVMRSDWGKPVIGRLSFCAVLGEPATIAIVVAAISFALAVYTYMNMPETPEQQEAGERAEFLGGQRNLAKLGDPIPVIYGKTRVYPDVAAITFSDFVENDQWLYQLFCIGHGEFNIEEEPRIDDTLFSEFGGAEYAVYGPGEHNNMLFPSNVVTVSEVSNVRLESLDQWHWIGATWSLGRIYFDATDDKIYLTGADTATKPFNSFKDALEAGDTITVTGTASNDGTYTVDSTDDNYIYVVESLVAEDLPADFVDILRTDEGWSGWFNTNAAGTDANKLVQDFGFLSGCIFVDAEDGGTESVQTNFEWEYQEIDDSGTPIGVVSKIQETRTESTHDAIFASSSATISTPSRQRVRARRTTNSKQTTRADFGGGSDELTWVQSKAYLVDANPNFGDVTLLAVILKSNGGSSSSGSNKVNILVKRKTQPYNQTTGLLDPLSANESIAWAALDMCVAEYGANKALTAIDADALYDLDQEWTARGDKISINIRNRKGFWQALQDVLRVGRAKPVNNNGFITFVRDEAEISANLPLFTPANMVPDSYGESYQFRSGGSDSNDYLIVEYKDEDKDYQANEVECILPGETSNTPKKITLKGCANRDQAYREGMYILATQYYRRKRVSFVTEMEGYLLQFGDHILVGHDINFNQYGVVESYNSFTQTVTTSEELIFTAGNNYIAIRDSSGNSVGAALCAAGVNANEVVLISAPSYAPERGDNFAFGELSTIYTQYIVLGLEPTDDDKVQVTAVIEDSRVHTADGGTVPANYTDQALDKVKAVPVIDFVVATTNDDKSILFINWTAAQGAIQYEVEIQPANSTTWVKVGFSKNAKMQYVYEVSQVTNVRVRGWSDQAAGPWNETIVGLGGVFILTTESGDWLSAEDGTLLTTE